MIDYHLLYDIALGDTKFQKGMLARFQKESGALLNAADILKETNSWVSLHLLVKSYRNKVSPLLTPEGLEKINTTLEVLISPLNNSSKHMAYLSLHAKIKRQLTGLGKAA